VDVEGAGLIAVRTGAVADSFSGRVTAGRIAQELTVGCDENEIGTSRSWGGARAVRRGSAHGSAGCVGNAATTAALGPGCAWSGADREHGLSVVDAHGSVATLRCQAAITRAAASGRLAILGRGAHRAGPLLNHRAASAGALGPFETVRGAQVRAGNLTARLSHAALRRGGTSPSGAEAHRDGTTRRPSRASGAAGSGPAAAEPSDTARAGHAAGTDASAGPRQLHATSTARCTCAAAPGWVRTSRSRHCRATPSCRRTTRATHTAGAPPASATTEGLNP